MSLSKKSLTAGLSTIAAGAATAVFLQASQADPQKGFSLFMSGDLFPGCAVNSLQKSSNGGDLEISNTKVSKGEQSIARLTGYRFETTAQTPEAAREIKDSFKDCLMEQTFNPDIRVLRVVPYTKPMLR